MRTFVYALTGIGLFLLASPRVGAAPINDEFNNAITLTGPIVTTTGSNVGANKNFFGEPFIAGNPGGANVWWNWTATASGQTTIDTMGSSFDTLLGVYTGTLGALTLVADNDNYNGNTWSRVQFNAVAGTTYRIQVDGVRSGPRFGTLATGNIVLNIHGVGGLSIDSPTNGMVFTFGDPIPFSASTDTNFPNPPAMRMDFYHSGQLFASSDTAPFTAVATNIPPGSNSFYVVAIDSTGAAIQSSIINILVQNVGVTLLTPFEDTVYGNTNPIKVTAWSYLPAGAITNVDFFVDGQLFGSAQTPPLSATWSNVIGGSHRLTAIGRSDSGAAYSSQPVNIGVAQLLVHSNAVWKYLDNGSDQGTNWVAPGFDDSTWASGPAELGYGDGDETTVVSGGVTNSYYATTYFRRAFVATNVSGISSLIMSIAYDDAAIVYLNGKEVARAGSLPAVVLYNTYATGAAIEETVDTDFLSSTNLVEGTNVLAVEMHQQAPTSSDISFFLQLLGVPVIIHNLSPTVELTSPAADSFYLAAPSIDLAARASDADGSVAKVEFYADGVKVDEDSTDPYNGVWNNPPLGPHLLTAVATDDQGARTESAPVPIIVYDAVGTPYIQILGPTNGTSVEGGTNLLITVLAKAPTGVTNVQFFANGTLIGNSSIAPFNFVWDATFGTNSIVAVAFDTTGASGTSSPITLIAYPNTVAPYIVTNSPPAFATITNLTSISITFSEPVKNVDAGDLLLNGIPATGVSGSGSNYVFTFPQQAYGEVEIAWANGHGITDLGYPVNLPFDELGQSATWEYFLIDKTPPFVQDRIPARGSTVTNLSEIHVSFNEAVTGVDATDLLINGSPAISVLGSGTNYVFHVGQPASGTVNITWVSANGIFDLAETPNAFINNNASNTWSFTLDTRAVLIQSNSFWRFVKGTNEASDPTDAWRQLGFDDSGWSNSQAPFFFGDPYTNFPAGIYGTLLSDMQSNYTTVFLRQSFVVNSRGAITNLVLNHQSDDGFIAWLNGVEVWRYNVPSGDLTFDATASTAANEPNNVGAAYILATLTNAAVSRLVDGTNELAIMAFNQSLTASSDFGFNAQLYYWPLDSTVVPPRLVSADPPPGDLFVLTNVTISFSEGVIGVDAGALLVNGVAASAVSSDTNTIYTFSFPQPAYGPVLLSWDPEHAIIDFDVPPKPFDGNAANAKISYTLLNPSSPRILTQTPLAGTTITGLTSITLTFTEPVTNVEATDLLVNGTPVNNVTSADGITYTFSFPQPAFGTVAIRWATNHGITDIEVPPAPFDPTRFGGQWNYTLVDPVPSVNLTSPTNNAYVLAPANVPLRANATDNDGTVALVEFLQNEVKVGEVATAPYNLVVSNVPQGVYTFKAVATDNIGLIRTSAPVVLNVVTSLPVFLVRGPYLQIGSSTGAVVRWRTDQFSDAVVFYGQDPANLTDVAFQAMQTNEHIVTITGLEPETKYYYSIGSSAQRLAGTNGPGSDFYLKTSPVPGTRKHARLWVVGDSGTAGNGPPDRVNSVRDAFYNLAATNGAADMFLMLGDNAYNSGQDSEYQAAVFDIFPTLLRNTFLWPTIGNHESNQSTTANDYPYLNIFSLPHNGEAGGVPSGTQKYYSFDFGNIHLVCLDSETSGYTTNTAMFQWMKDDLAASTGEWNIVFFHHPPYTHGTHNSDVESDLIQIRENFIPVLEDYGVDLVLNGHSHVYERSYLLDRHYGVASTFSPTNKIDGGTGRPEETGAYRKNSDHRGVVYNVCGCSGQALGGTLDHPAHVVSLNILGSLVIDVNKGRLDVKFLTPTGDFNDHYTLVKGALPATPVGFAALPVDANTISLSWMNAATNADGFLVERSIDGVDYTAIATNTVDTTNVLDSGLLANITYFYRVHALGNGGESSPAGASVTTVSDLTPPLPPSALIASGADAATPALTHRLLHWADNSANESGFLIERATDGGDFVPVATVGANIAFYVDRDLPATSAYVYRVRSFNPAGQSAPSNLSGGTGHPQDTVVLLGGTATLHAGTDGVPPLGYQWRFNGQDLPGQNDEALVINDADISDEGPYTVMVTDAGGPVVSNPAWLFVLAPPLIVEQPTSSTNVIGTAAEVHVVANGAAPLVYQWRKNGANLPGATTAQLSIPTSSMADQANYDVLIYNSLGASTSQVARLTMNNAPVAGPDSFSGFSYQSMNFNAATLLANDSDIDGDALSITSVNPASAHGGTVSLLDQSILFTPSGAFAGDDSFTYTLTDARGASVPGVVTISLSPNRPPVLAPRSNLVINVLSRLMVTNLANDPDSPTNNVTLTISGVPGNSHLDNAGNRFYWTPLRSQAGKTNVVTLRVFDDGVPPLTNSTTFNIVVNDYLEATLGTTPLNAGENGTAPLTLFSSAPMQEIQCVVTMAGDRLTNSSAELLASPAASLAVQTPDSNTLALTLTALAGQTLQGTQRVTLRFGSVASQSSAFLPLHVSALTGTRAGEGYQPSALATDGKVAVVSDQPLVEVFPTNSGRALVLYGKKSTTYNLEYNTDLLTTNWLLRGPVSMGTTNMRLQSVGTTVPPPVFYRMRK